MPTNGADTLLMLMGLALVLLMTPGLAFFYGGFTRAKNVLNTMMMSFFMMGLIGVVWVVIGYSLSFGTGFKSPFIGGLEFFMLNGVGGPLGDAPLADGFSISATSFALFQGMFAIITPALIITYGFVGLGTAIILVILGRFMSLRVSPADEDRGLDFIAHGEEAYDPMMN